MSIEIRVRANTEAVLNELKDRVVAALEAAGAQAENYAKLKCPVDTGLLRNSITHAQADEKTEVIGTNVEYAPYVEMGTSKQKAQPYLKPALTDHISEYKRIMESMLQS